MMLADWSLKQNGPTLRPDHSAQKTFNHPVDFLTTRSYIQPYG
jgi:hypothetical protein